MPSVSFKNRNSRKLKTCRKKAGMMAQERKKPESLFDQCIKFVVSHPNCLATTDPNTCELHLKTGVSFPSAICEKIIHIHQLLGKPLNDKFINIFQNPNVTRLRRVRLKRFDISNEKLCMLLNHNLLELDIPECLKLTDESIKRLNERGDKLVSLSLRKCKWNSALKKFSFTFQKKTDSPITRKFYLSTPNIQRLVITHLKISEDRNYFSDLLAPLKQIMYLDLSECCDLGNLSYLTELPRLTNLILHNVKGLRDKVTLNSIMKLKQLRNLDISQNKSDELFYEAPDDTLASLVENLPNLVSLDISGTNLAGDGKDPIILGLKGRSDNPLQFLGLYKTCFGACRREGIPAKRISGDMNEDQLLNAGNAYIHRPEVLFNVFEDLRNLLKNKNVTRMEEVLNIALESMYRYQENQKIQLLGSTLVLYVAKPESRVILSTESTQRVITATLNMMDAFSGFDPAVRIGLTVLRQFDVPDDMLFDYERVISVLLKVITDFERQFAVAKPTMQLINDMGYGVGTACKKTMGDMGVITKMLRVITHRLKNQDCDEVLDLAWSTIWNVTDETPINSERFLNEGGMRLFLKSISSYQDDALFTNIMGLMGNVSEVSHLRPHLMNKEFITAVLQFLNFNRYGLEITYDAAGILSHLCSDGTEAWTISEPTRESVLHRLRSEIEKWNVPKKTKNDITFMSYMTFRPLYRLLKAEHTPECQLWAAWALADLTLVNPEKNCALLEEEGVYIHLLEKITDGRNASDLIVRLAQLTIDNCRLFREKKLQKKSDSNP